MIKATAGGGGKGMRVVWKRKKWKMLGNSARQESAAALGMMVCTWRNSLKNHVILKFKLREINSESMSLCQKEIVLFNVVIKNW